jgi:hypothetical protein
VRESHFTSVLTPQHSLLVGCTDLLSQRASRQYLRRCRVSRPGSGWDGVAPRRFSHTTGSGASAEASCWLGLRSSHLPFHVFPQGSPRPCAPVACTCHHASSSGRLPSRLLGDLLAYSHECTHLAVHFPLRCFQRFLLPDIATQPAGRPTTAPPAVRPRRSSRTERSSAQCTKRP